MSGLHISFENRLVGAVPRLKKLAYALTASAPDSDDLVQSTIERAIARQHQCTDVAKVESWAVAILRSIWKNEIRSRSVRRGNGLENVDQLVDQKPPERQYEVGQLREAVQALPEHYRSVVLLVDVYGMTYQETADMLELPQGTVMSRLSRARNQLLVTFNKSQMGIGTTQ